MQYPKIIVILLAVLIVLLIAAILRFYQLSYIPPALDWDEVSNAYNGYSILKTGRDEFLQKFPVLFRAYDGYVPPVLIYLNSISVFFFGLNEFAARFPNAFLGTLTVFGVYLVVTRLAGNDRLAKICALFLAISPWHIFYSRINVFPTTPIFFIVFGIYFFLVGLERKSFLILATISFILATFSYFSAYVFVPLFVLVLSALYRKKLNINNLLLLVFPPIICSFSLLFLVSGGQNRLRGVWAFADRDIFKQSSEEAIAEGLLGKIAHNRRFVYGQKFLEGYFVNWRFDFLFGKGDAVERMRVPGVGFGLLYLVDLPLFVAGIYYMISKKSQRYWIFVAWLLLAPVAAAVSLPQPTSTRASLMIPIVQIVCAFGFWNITRRKSRFVVGIVILALAFNFLLFAHQYFVHFPKEKSKDWFYGYKQLFNLLNMAEYSGNKVHFIFEGGDSLDQIHMFTLFWNKLDPSEYQKNGGTRLSCVATTADFSFNRYDFVPYHCLSKPVDFGAFGSEDLIVTSRSIGADTLRQVNLLNGNVAFYIWRYGEIKNELFNLFVL